MAFAGRLSKPEGFAMTCGVVVPVSLEVTAEGELTAGSSAIYKANGLFVPEGDHVVGTVLCVANDWAGQPDGTVGAFVLYFRPVRSMTLLVRR